MPIDTTEIRTVRRAENEEEANAFIERGWYIIGLEYQGECDQSEFPQLVGRRTVFMMGHLEEDAV